MLFSFSFGYVPYLRTNNMKAISIKQPWASLIAHGIKDIENRTWKCPQKYLGQRILIHASSSGQPSLSDYTQEQLLKLNREVKSYTSVPFMEGFPKARSSAVS